MVQLIGAAAGLLKPCKRYICTHDKNGRSVYAESPDQLFNGVPGFGGLARSFAVASVPANLANDQDIKAYRAESGSTSYQGREIVNTEPSGVNLVVVDLEPGAKGTMHRTVSIDFSICVQGEVVHELDSGETVTLHPGDRIVQRGTNHRWHNASKTKPARFVAVALPCVPFDIAGEPLRERHISSDKWDKMKAKL